MNTFFWVMSSVIVSIQLVNHWFYGKGRLDISYPMTVVSFIGYLILETALAFHDPDQKAVLLFNITNLWGLFNAAKGWYRLREEKKNLTGV